MGQFTSYITGISQQLLGPIFQPVWEEFKTDCEAGFDGMKFELVKGNRPKSYLIGCRPKLDAGATTTLAIIEIVNERSLLFSTADMLSQIEVTDVTVFASCLGNLVVLGSPNNRMIQLMQNLNNQPMYEGILVTGEPYEIASDSIRVLIPNQECRNILERANLGENEYVCDVNNVNINVGVAYPPTLHVVNPAYSYRFFTFQGFLFEVLQQPHVVQPPITISFQIKLKYNMRM